MVDAPLFIRRDFATWQQEPARFRESLDPSLVSSAVDRLVERFHHERYVQLTWNNPLVPSFFRNIAVRPFWRVDISSLKEDRWIVSDI